VDIKIREDRISNEYLRGSSVDRVIKMKESRLRWFGHVMRREHSNDVRTVMEINVEGRRGRGRLKK